jgi:hypothetical protein
VLRRAFDLTFVEQWKQRHEVDTATTMSGAARFGLLVHHTDAKRE